MMIAIHVPIISLVTRPVCFLVVILYTVDVVLISERVNVQVCGSVEVWIWDMLQGIELSDKNI